MDDNNKNLHNIKWISTSQAEINSISSCFLFHFMMRKKMGAKNPIKTYFVHRNTTTIRVRFEMQWILSDQWGFEDSQWQFQPQWKRKSKQWEKWRWWWCLWWNYLIWICKVFNFIRRKINTKCYFFSTFNSSSLNSFKMKRKEYRKKDAIHCHKCGVDE